MLIYYFFCEIIPAIADINSNDLVIDLVHTMCKKDAATTLTRKHGGYFGQDIMGEDDFEGSVDDEADQPDNED